MPEAPTREEAARYLARSTDDLYTLIPPGPDGGYAKGNPLEAGRIAFEGKLREVRPAVCNAYWSRPGSTNDAIDLTVLVAGVLVSLPLGGIPVLPMAALIVKIGLRELCPAKQ
jgi:hypothetical protein